IADRAYGGDPVLGTAGDPVCAGLAALGGGRHPHVDGAGGGYWAVPAAAPDRERHRGVRSQPGAARVVANGVVGNGDVRVTCPGPVGPPHEIEPYAPDGASRRARCSISWGPR